MALSKKRAPSSQDPNMNRVIGKIYDDMNEIINAVNQGDTSREKDAVSGKPGDMRIVKVGNGEYYLEAKTEEGWIRSTSDTTNYPSGFKFKERE